MLLHAAAIFWFLTTFWQALIRIGIGSHIARIIAGIGNSRFDVFDIGPFGYKSHFGYFLFEIHIGFLYPIFPFQVPFNPVFTAFTLNGRSLDSNCLNAFFSPAPK